MHILQGGHDSEDFLLNLIVGMYTNCGALMDARSVFDIMNSQNVFTWTLLIAAYVQHGDHSGAVQLYQRMQQKEIKPTKVTFVSVLRACSGITALAQGREIHVSILENACESDVIVGTALINMYHKCGDLESARGVFDRIHARDVIAWNTIIAAYIHHCQDNSSMRLYQQMLQNDVKPNAVTFITILGSCCNSPIFSQGKAVHISIVDSGFESDVIVGTAIVNMYGKCRSPKDARMVFDKIIGQNVISWNAMIAAYMQNGHDTEALFLYCQMKTRQELKPNHITFVNVLGACTTLASVSHGKNIHANIVDNGLESDILVGTALFNMYGKCGSLMNARRVFDKLSVRDLVTWNAMLSTYIQNGQGKEAFYLYQQMLGEGLKPDKFTFNTLLSACSSPAALAQGKSIHDSIVDSGLELEASVGAALVSMYSKCGNVKGARNVFERLHRQDVLSWNVMLAAYSQYEHDKEALQLYQEMEENGVKPNEFTFSAILGACPGVAALALGKEIHVTVVDRGYDSDTAVVNALVNMYGKCGSVEDASIMFDRMHKRDVISWNAIIAAHAQNGFGKETLRLYGKMQQQGIEANDITFVGTISACSHTGLVEEGLKHLDSMKKVYGIVPTVEHYACVVDLYCRLGRLEEAEEFINNIPIQPDAVVWKNLLGACMLHSDTKRGKKAARHALELESESPIPYVLLSNMCAASGSWNELSGLPFMEWEWDVTTIQPT